MKQYDELTRENEVLRGRLSRLSEAGRRINESPEPDEVRRGHSHTLNHTG